MTPTMTERSWRSSELRIARACIRRGLRSGQLTLAELLAAEVPASISSLPLFELVSWHRGWGKDAQRRIGMLAIRDRVNLAIHAGDASDRSLGWVVALEETFSVFGPRAAV